MRIRFKVVKITQPKIDKLKTELYISGAESFSYKLIQHWNFAAQF